LILLRRVFCRLHLATLLPYSRESCAAASHGFVNGYRRRRPQTAGRAAPRGNVNIPINEYSRASKQGGAVSLQMRLLLSVILGAIFGCHASILPSAYAGHGFLERYLWRARMVVAAASGWRIQRLVRRD
jgi:hypothetical protein